MIVRMSKVEIIGPKEDLLDTLALIQQTRAFQVEEEIHGGVNEQMEPYLKSLLFDSQSLAQRLFLEDLKHKIDRLCACLPPTTPRETYLNPVAILDSIAELVEKHAAACRELFQKKEALTAERQTLDRYATFLETVAPLMAGFEKEMELEFIGLELKDLKAVELLHRLANRATGGRFELQAAEGKEGTAIVLLGVERDRAGALRQALRQEQLPEFVPPSRLEEVPLVEKLPVMRQRLTEIADLQVQIDRQIATFASRWSPIYLKIQKWLVERLRLLQTTASLFQTKMCFFILGWMPSADLETLKTRLLERFGGKVSLEEKEILEQDVARIPVILKNPLYFQPFELFTRLLPLPRYSSFDPTPFIGIFFPIFFGMILGDIGYGLVLLLVALALVFLTRDKKMVVDAGKILGVCALYTIFFGWLFGECFGEWGSRLLGLEPICFDRRTAILPTLYFSLAVGIVHIVVGLLLGFIAAWRKKMKKEALFKLVSILVVLCLVALAASYHPLGSHLLRQPLLMVLLIALPVLLLTGGLLAPLEVLKHFGHIISYARIMAVGLTSVLLAYVANQLAGMAGSVLLGTVAAILLHAFNLLLGVFAPTVHSLRLHYVEFFSKFFETGGRRFRPLDKP